MSRYLSDLVDSLKPHISEDQEEEFDPKLSIQIQGMIVPVDEISATPYEIILKPRTE